MEQGGRRIVPTSAWREGASEIGDLSRDTAATVIDASGLVVAPGFINIHSHASALSTAANMLKQGVTTEI